MGPVVKGSVALAVAVGLVSILIAATGMHKNPMAGMAAVVLFIAFNIGAIIWVLKQSAAENGYGRQLLNALLVGVIAGVLIFVISWLNLSVLFPNYLHEMREGTIAMMEGAGIPEAQLDAQVAKLDGMTPVNQSVSGTIGTAITSLVIGAIAAIFLRKK